MPNPYIHFSGNFDFAAEGSVRDLRRGASEEGVKRRAWCGSQCKTCLATRWEAERKSGGGLRLACRECGMRSEGTVAGPDAVAR